MRDLAQNAKALLGIDIARESNSSEDTDQRAISVTGTTFHVFASLVLEEKQVNQWSTRRMTPPEDFPMRDDWCVHTN
jgi:hypothetical protein